MKLPYPLPTYLPPLSIYTLPYLIRMPYFRHVLTYSNFLSQFSASFRSINVPLPQPMAKFDENLLHNYFVEMIGVMPAVLKNFRKYMMEGGGVKKTERFSQLSEILKKNEVLRWIEYRELEGSMGDNVWSPSDAHKLMFQESKNEKNDEKDNHFKNSIIESRMIIEGLLEGEEDLTKTILLIAQSGWLSILKNSASSTDEKTDLANVFLRLDLSKVKFRVRNKLLAEIFNLDPDNVGLVFFSQMNVEEFLDLTKSDPKEALCALTFLNKLYSENRMVRKGRNKNFLKKEWLVVLTEYEKEIINILSDEKNYKNIFRSSPSKMVRDIVCYLTMAIKKNIISKNILFNLGVLRLKLGKDFIQDKQLLEMSEMLAEEKALALVFFEPELQNLCLRACEEIQKGKATFLYQYSSMVGIESYVKAYHKQLMEELFKFLKKKSLKICKKYTLVEKIMKSLSFLQIRIEEDVYKNMTSAIIEENKFVRDHFILNCFPEMLEMVKSPKELIFNRFSLVSNILFYNFGSIFYVFNDEEREKYLKKMLYFSQIAMHANMLQSNQNIDKIIEVLTANLSLSLEYMTYRYRVKYFLSQDRYLMIFKENASLERNIFMNRKKRKINHLASLPENDISNFLSKNSIQFEREVPIARFAVDFVINSKLIIEYFGLSHFYLDEYEKVFKLSDQARIIILEKLGYKVVVITCYQWKKFKKAKEREKFLLDIVNENLK